MPACDCSPRGLECESALVPVFKALASEHGGAHSIPVWRSSCLSANSAVEWVPITGGEPFFLETRKVPHSPKTASGHDVLHLLPSIVAVVVVALTMTVAPTSCEYQLTILHTNDVHARFDETSVYSSSPCPPNEVAANNCFGGFARLVTASREVRQTYNNTLFLDAGDQFQGTIWFYYFGQVVTPIFVNHLQYDALAIGNHEFDRGVSYLVPYLQNVTATVVNANIDATLEPEMKPLFEKSVIKTVGGQRIGIIGYTTQETPDLSSAGQNLKFGDVVEAVRKEAEALTRQGINKIIALGHAGYSVDKEIATIPGVDVVVGGHSHTFLYNASNLNDRPSTEVALGDYPTVVEKNGSRALVVQAYAYSKYLGILHVTFDDNGNVIDYNGKPRLLDASVQNDNATLEMLKPWREKVSVESSSVIGKTLVNLEGSSTICRIRECNLGNLIADGMIYGNRKLLEQDPDRWSDVTIAITNGGGIRDTIVRGNVTIANILNVMPFQNTIDAITIKGKYLQAALEHSVSRYKTCNQTGDLFGGFLQVSGLQVRYDLSQPVGQRVVSVQALCNDCLVPRYFPLEAEKVYKVILPSFVRTGGDGYTMFRDNALNTELYNRLDSEVFLDYVKKTSPIAQGIEGRIQYVVGPNDCPTSGYTSGASSLVTMGTLVYFTALLVCLYH
ncbi:5'-nucleotidase-like isoform X2 [Pomacea canaliculata]|uniref:5'-nucleotidase-like isoform X2 n=1 Tax=Pomacea canaliculata TaxID=400727 RepID=UPI000D72BFBF|nr:5'-nucleotidase-like isoform X2 [Pomacea canaliculata]